MVRWSREHLRILEEAFPELTGSTDANALLVNAGRREVVLYVKSRLRIQNPTSVSHIPEDILYGDDPNS